MKLIRYLVFGLFVTVLPLNAEQLLLQPWRYEVKNTAQGSTPDKQKIIQNAMIPGGDDLGYAETITPDIQALADGLQDDPVKIFNYVHDHIKFVLYYGSMKGAELTLLEQSGNDFDQCALLSALLEAAGYSPGYGFGMLEMPYQATDGTANDLQHWLRLSVVNTNWNDTTNYFGQLLGERGYPVAFYMDDDNTVAFQRIWVTLTIGGTNYVLDPAFKVNEPINSQINLATAMGFSSNAVMTAVGGIDTANYVTNLNENNLRSLLTGYTTNLLNYIQSNCPNASVQQVLGGWQIVPSTNAGLSQTLLFPTFTDDSNYPLQTWSNEPTNFMSTFSITFAGTNQTWFFPQLQGQGVSLSFDTNGASKLWVNNSVILQSTNTGPGLTTNVTLAVTHPYGGWDMTNNVPLDSGLFDESQYKAFQRTNANYAIMYCFDPSVKWLNKQEQQLDQYIEMGYSNTAPQVVNATLNVMGMEWMVQTELAHDILCQEDNQLPEFNHRIGRMAQEIGNGYYVDIYLQQDQTFPATGVGAGDILTKDQVFVVSNYIWSGLEHAIIQQTQASNLVAASTIKLLQIANTNGQAIYLINSNNWSSVSGSLTNYTPYMSSFAAAVNLGYEFLLPQNGKIPVVGSGSWTGTAFIQWFTSGAAQALGMAIGQYQGGFAPYPSLTVNAPFTQEVVINQPSVLVIPPVLTTESLTLDPVDTADDTYQVQSTDLALGQAEPRGIAFSRYYNGTRRLIKTSGMPGGWVHNYCVTADNVAAPQAGLGESTPAQMAASLTTTMAALGVYNNLQPDPKNWMVTALIAKWGVDQLIKNGVSVNLGKDMLQFVQQPNGSFTPPAKSTATLSQSGSNYTLLMRHGNTFTFNSTGLLTGIMDPYGKSLLVSYGSSNLINQVTDWHSRTLQFKYNALAELTNVVDSSGRSISYGYSTNYSPQGDLTSFTDAGGHTTTYTYDTNHNLVATIDAQGRMVVSNNYDSQGLLTSQTTDGDSNKISTIYYSGYNTIEFDAEGGEANYSYDGQGRLIAMEDALGNVTRAFYDGQNQAVETMSALGETNLYFYDGYHNLTNSTDPLGFVTQYIYDYTNNLIKAVDPRGNSTTFGYNIQYSLTGQTNGAGDWENNVYNTDGTLYSQANSGATNVYSYDGYGQVSGITYPSTFGSETFVNSSLGDVTSHTDPRGFITTFGYNSLRELTNTIEPTNVITRITYDAEGNAASTVDARSNVTSQTWSATRKLLSTIMPTVSAGAPIVTNFYDTRDLLIGTLDPLQNLTTYTNDPDERLVAVTDPLERITTYSYDADGRKLFSINAASETNSQTWDPKGELLAQVDSAGHTSFRGYDQAGNQVILTNRNGNVWKFYFDGANRLTNTVSPLNHSTIVSFNHQGLISSRKDPAGNTTMYYFDARGRITNRADSFADTYYRYDTGGNQTNVIEKNLTNIWTYDAYNHISSYKDIYGNLIQYKYDANGNLTNLIYPGIKNVYYSYDSENHMTNVTDWSGRRTTMTYDLDGHLTGIYRPNGTYRTITYDLDGEETNILEQAANGTPIAWSRYNWNPAAEMGWEFAAPLPHTASIPTRSMTYDADNELQTVDGNTVTLDSNGNLLSGPLTNDTFAAYTYDIRNRLTIGGGVTNLYDAANNRIGQFYATNSVVYVMNPNAKFTQVLMRVKNGLTNYYVYGQGLLYQVMERATGTNTLTYHYDYRGSTVALSDDGGNVKDRFEYSLYAILTYSLGIDDTPFLFNGRYGVMSDPNGLLYMRARFYNPFLCRFLNPDPSGFAAGLNFYAYAGGNPTTMTDPLGLDSFNNQLNSWIGSQSSWSIAGSLPNAGSSDATPTDLSNPFNMPIDQSANNLQPCIECHGVSAGGFSGNINGFSGLTTIPGVSPQDAAAMDNFSYDLQSQGPQFVAQAEFLFLTAGIGIATSMQNVENTSAGSIPIAEGEANLVVMKNNQLVNQAPISSTLTHEDFAAQNGALAADGSVAPGYWVGTVGKVNGNIIGLNSQTLYNNQLPNADATFSLRTVFY